MGERETSSACWRMIDRKLSVAPMMDWTDRHDRYFLRLLSKHALLYTEMITTGALLHGDRERFLRYDESEHPIACQLGGSDPHDLALCAKMVEDANYDEVNLNVGCPSDRVQNGRFGACLMADPALVGECVQAMQAAVSIPVTVKTRIGIDHQDSYEELQDFIRSVPCDTFIVHARKAWLQGLSPRENREIPPLKYDVVHSLKRDFPEKTIVINGGITTPSATCEQLEKVDGVMLGRAAYQNPYILMQLDHALYGEKLLTREAIISAFVPYMERQVREGVSIVSMTRHILGLYMGQPGARRYRRYLSENARFAKSPRQLIEEALAYRDAGIGVAA